MPTNERSQDELHAAARDWVVALVSGNVDAATMSAFLAWQAENPAHAAAFDKARRLYAGAVTHEITLRARSDRRFRRPVLVAGALAACFALGLLFSRPEMLFPPDYAAPDGPARNIALADGSRVLLDGGSAIDIRMSPDRRDITLLRGRAWFQVMHDTARPFVVAANGGTTTDISTAFAVDATGVQTRVDVTQGIVRVEAAGGRRMLRAGDNASWTADNLTASTSQGDALAWREGQIIIRNQRFGDAARLLDNYIPGHVLVIGGIADAKVGGVFASRNAEKGLEALARSQGAHIRRFGGFLVVTSR